MSFLSRLFGKKSEEVTLNGNGLFELEVVGESSYQRNLETICGPRTEEGEDRVVEARLILENDNPYDKNAVAVEISNLKVGYLSREVARLYRAQLKKSGHPTATACCKAKIKGGWKRKNSKGHYGVWLDIPVE